MKYELIVAGGTFDLLHKGHKSFLQSILDKTDRLILGLTSDNYVSSKKKGNTEDFDTRKRNLEEFLFEQKEKVEIVPIDDIFGPLLDFSFRPDAIAVTQETKKSIEIINDRRKSLGLSILESINIPMDLAEDGSEISSTRIRKGEIDRGGKLYFKKNWQGKNFTLPVSLRPRLAEPFGKILDEIPKVLNSSKTVTVGDETSKLFNEKNMNQFLSIVDFKIHRQKEFQSVGDLGFDGEIKVYNIKNLPGQISSELFYAVKFCLSKKERCVILVDGEEDLAVLPVLIFSPLGIKIYYGQPNEGLVEVEVTEENKNKARRLLSSFEITSV